MLVALRKLRAAYAVSPNFLWKAGLIDFGEADLMEKSWSIGKGKYAADTQFLCISKTTLHEAASYTCSLAPLMDSKGTDLGKIFPEHMQCTNPGNPVIILGDKKIAKVLVQLINGPRYHFFPAGELIDQLLYIPDVSYGSFSDVQCIVSLPVLFVY